MHVIIRRSLCAAIFTGGLLAVGAGAASAADQSGTGSTENVAAGQGSVSQGSTSISAAHNSTQDLLGDLLGDVLGNVPVTVPVTVPVAVSDNAVGVLGHAASAGSQAEDTATVPGVDQDSREGAGFAGAPDVGLLGDVLGNVQVAVPVMVPVAVSDNFVGVLGDAASAGSQAEDTATVLGVDQDSREGAGFAGAPDVGLLGDVLGNVQVAVPVMVPVAVSDNAVGVLGDAASSGSEATNTVTPVVPVSPAVPATPVTTVVPVTPAVPATPVNPVNPVAPATSGTQVTPIATVVTPTPAISTAPVAQVAPAGSLQSMSSGMSSGVQALSAAAPAQLAYTGSGLWPVYGSGVALVAGLGMLMVLRRFTHHSRA